jgi:hypothetical protein
MSKEFREILEKVLTSELWSVEEELQAKIRELLTQPEKEDQQPVAWMCNLLGDVVTDKPADNNGYTALYKSPKREPLSDDEIFNLGYNAGFTLDHVKNDDDCSAYGFLNEYGYIDNNPYFKFVRAIEKEHGIGVENE